MHRLLWMRLLNIIIVHRRRCLRYDHRAFWWWNRWRLRRCWIYRDLGKLAHEIFFNRWYDFLCLFRFGYTVARRFGFQCLALSSGFDLSKHLVCHFHAKSTEIGNIALAACVSGDTTLYTYYSCVRSTSTFIKKKCLPEHFFEPREPKGSI